MGDKLRKEHEELKAELKKLIKRSMSFFKQRWWTSLTATSRLAMKTYKRSISPVMNCWREKKRSNFNGKLVLLTKKVDIMTKEIDEATAYSYQYNIKIVGVLQIDRTESADGTTEMCI